MTAGLDTPDRRGRTGLDRHGLDLTGNPRVRIHDVEVLSCDWYVLRRTTFDYEHTDGHVSREQRETYDRGDGATILLHNAAPYDPADNPTGTTGIAAEGEDITTVELPFTEALDTVRDGTIVDAKTVMLLQWAALDGPFRSQGPLPRRNRP